jgi:cytochrome c
MNKRLTVILSCTILAAACGSSGESKPTDSATKAPSTTAAPATTNADSKGLELIGASDCTTCHRLDKAGSGASIGPAYSEVAEKYSPAADSTVNRLIKKIISGGSGVWGSVPMTPHPSVPEADVKEMVKYILALKK